ncbi:response regulator [Actinoalloteichus hymeniacidonis]|uniref:Two component transcriptional regulator, LuxR family n=1 Tax=Actinoalloteichus hymeniacidonis TaxID=340345 RepID=A0AAC9HT60_9PSEU|nr:response regulator transcription factor [Actinoalloteichus hymeniacidonis]AOS64973.1 two component transcriptional regulator, LuxR family [Actinoalloteichus hymeniacidonis]MBB5906952.1 DNA-binding NarL/FixJ family response regulator [Actinoalloteichus hymeniacidonis]
MTIAVVVADDQAVVRAGFRTILEVEPDMTVVGEAADGAQAVAAAQRLRPNLVLMDVRMPGVDGIAATRTLAASNPDIPVLIITTFDLDEYVFSALRAGAAGFLLKDTEPDDLVLAVRAVAAGDGLVSPRVTRRLIAEFASSSPAPPTSSTSVALTARERQTLLLVAEGLSNAEIAASLVVSPSTVKTHVGNVLAKIGARDRVQAVIWAYEHGIVRPGA